MATVYLRVGGKKLTKVIALHETVQTRLDTEALFRAQIAEGLLNSESKHRTGTSTIDVEEGDVDRYVILDDTRGLNAALSIEYGHSEIHLADGTVISASEGLFVLHRAFQLRGATLSARPKKGGDNLVE